MSIPSDTPNVIVQNPHVRKVVGNTLAAASLILSIATLVDGAIDAVAFAHITGPAAVIIAGLFGIFQLTVTSPNVPTAADTSASEVSYDDIRDDVLVNISELDEQSIFADIQAARARRGLPPL